MSERAAGGAEPSEAAAPPSRQGFLGVVEALGGGLCGPRTVSWHMNVRPFSEGTVGHPLPSPSGWGRPGTPTLSANHITCRG